MRKIILFLLFIITQAVTAQQLAWPELTKENKPWTRWWWPGSIVNQADLTSAMEKYHNAGLGGMEITAIYGVRGQEDKFLNYLSPGWMDMLKHTLKEGERLGLGIDLANASGWPFGGPWVNKENASRNINYKTWELNGGEKLTEKIEFLQQPFVRPLTQNADLTLLSNPLTRKRDPQLYAIDQIRIKEALPLHILMAYSDSGAYLDLTGRVTSEMDLDWVAPPGKWTLHALFMGWHGKQVERAGPGGEGDVIDHFSRQAITRFLGHFDSVFKDHDLKSLRGYFNDSYEVDDASGQANWTHDLLYEFWIRRGYDLAENLPALFQKDSPEKNARVLQDYRQTVSDLLLEKFTSYWTSWANRQGKTTRNQAHGSPGNILDLYAASDIPETEGYELTKLKFASSAANVTGKKYISCEAATWLNEHFISDLADIKKTADLFFLGGINHLFYHGTCYSPQNEPWPGFLFYAAVELTPVNPLWNDFRGLNNYIARSQSFLQQGMPDNDILLYFPIFDRYADWGKGMLEHFDAISAAYNGTPFKTAAEAMIEKGYAYDFISDLQIKNTFFFEGSLQTEGNFYKTLILPGSKYIPVETFAQVLNLANNGANIILYGDFPENVSGWAELEEKTQFFEQMKSGVRFSPTNNPGVLKATYGKGMILTGKDLEQLLTFAGIRREPMADNHIGFTRRETPTGFTYFLNNQGEKAFDGWVSLSVNASSVAIFNPMNNSFGLAKYRTARNGKAEVYVRLFPGESLIINTYNNPVQGKQFPYYDPAAIPGEISGKWNITFVEGGPTLPSSSDLDKLISWTELPDAKTKDFSGTAAYTINFAKPKIKADAWALNLGRVCESATVILNGKELGSLIGPDFQIIIGKKNLKKTNNLEIRVSNLMANRIAYMDRNNIEWKKFYNINFAGRLRQNTKDGIFDASSWQPGESGLLGPVTITPLKVVK